MKADLHLHTCYSPDSNSPLADIIERCNELGIECLAVTDHDTIEGALHMKELAPFTVIIGEEIMSTGGEIIGYFLKKRIPGGLVPRETIARIKDQGGLVCLPHPFDGFGRQPLQEKERQVLLSQIDIIEVFNARSLRDSYSEQALRFAVKHELLQSAGSDAHAPREVGKAYVEIPEFNGGPEEFKEALSQARVRGAKNGFVDHLVTTVSTLPKRLRNR